MTSLNRHDAGQLLDYALRLRLAGHEIKHAELRKPFIRRAKVLEKRALLLLGADSKFRVPPDLQSSPTLPV